MSIGRGCRLAISFDVGSEDPWHRPRARELDHELSVRHIPHEFHIFPGGHTWAYWSAHLADTLRFVGAQLRQHKG